VPVIIVLFLISVEAGAASARNSQQALSQSSAIQAPGTVAAAATEAAPETPSETPAISAAPSTTDPATLLQQAAGFLSSVMAENYLAAVV
jgi:hypothetical protein